MSEAAAGVGYKDYGWTSSEAEPAHDYLQPVVLRVLEAISKQRAPDVALRVFDAGCGNGALLRRLDGLGYVVAGCDASESGVQHSRVACGPDVRIERLSVCEDMATVFGSAWDAVVATEVIEHIYAPRAFIAQVERLLAPNGSLVLSTPYHGYLKNLALAATGALDRHFTALWDGGHIKFWSHRTLRTLLLEFGFRDIEFFGAGRLPWLWKSMVVVARKPLPEASR